MEGFFTREDVKAQAPIRKTAGCGGCGLFKNVKSPKMLVTGKGLRGILFVGTAPGKTEDEQGIQMVGKAGQLLRDELEEHGIDLDRDCWNTNALCCRLPDNRTPTPKEIYNCRPRLFGAIRDLKPHLIIPMGSTAISALYGESPVGDFDEKEVGGIGRWRGWQIPDRTHHAWVCPTFHPSYLLQTQQDREASVVQGIWRRDLSEAFGRIDKPVPEFEEETKQVKLLMTKEEVSHFLVELVKRAPITIALDYETTGRKPHAPGHRIRTMAISDSPDTAYAFPVFPENVAFICSVLECPEVRKIAHDVKFEDQWSRWGLWQGDDRLRPTVRGWVWCTMQASHVIDNRPDHINGLKFQAFVHFGRQDYSSHLDAFLKTSSKNANAMNSIFKAPLRDLLIYNGVDTLVTRRLAGIQRAILEGR